jgi:hypothetical protein
MTAKDNICRCASVFRSCWIGGGWGWIGGGGWGANLRPLPRCTTREYSSCKASGDKQITRPSPMKNQMRHMAICPEQNFHLAHSRLCKETSLSNHSQGRCYAFWED